MSITAAIEANEQAIATEPVSARVIFRAAGALTGPTHVELKARDHLIELADAVDAHCPVLDLFANPTTVERRLAVTA